MSRRDRHRHERGGYLGSDRSTRRSEPYKNENNMLVNYRVCDASQMAGSGMPTAFKGNIFVAKDSTRQLALTATEEQWGADNNCLYKYLDYTYRIAAYQSRVYAFDCVPVTRQMIQSAIASVLTPEFLDVDSLEKLSTEAPKRKAEVSLMDSGSGRVLFGGGHYMPQSIPVFHSPSSMSVASSLASSCGSGRGIPPMTLSSALSVSSDSSWLPSAESMKAALQSSPVLNDKNTVIPSLLDIESAALGHGIEDEKWAEEKRELCIERTEDGGVDKGEDAQQQYSDGRTQKKRRRLSAKKKKSKSKSKSRRCKAMADECFSDDSVDSDKENVSPLSFGEWADYFSTRHTAASGLALSLGAATGSRAMPSVLSVADNADPFHLEDELRAIHAHRKYSATYTNPPVGGTVGSLHTAAGTHPIGAELIDIPADEEVEICVRREVSSKLQGLICEERLVAELNQVQSCVRRRKYRFDSCASGASHCGATALSAAESQRRRQLEEQSTGSGAEIDACSIPMYYLSGSDTGTVGHSVYRPPPGLPSPDYYRMEELSSPPATLVSPSRTATTVASLIAPSLVEMLPPTRATLIGSGKLQRGTLQFADSEWMSQVSGGSQMTALTIADEALSYGVATAMSMPASEMMSLTDARQSMSALDLDKEKDTTEKKESALELSKIIHRRLQQMAAGIAQRSSGALKRRSAVKKTLVFNTGLKSRFWEGFIYCLVHPNDLSPEGVRERWRVAYGNPDRRLNPGFVSAEWLQRHVHGIGALPQPFKYPWLKHMQLQMALSATTKRRAASAKAPTTGGPVPAPVVESVWLRRGQRTPQRVAVRRHATGDYSAEAATMLTTTPLRPPTSSVQIVPRTPTPKASLFCATDGISTAATSLPTAESLAKMLSGLKSTKDVIYGWMQTTSSLEPIPLAEALAAGRREYCYGQVTNGFTHDFVAHRYSATGRTVVKQLVEYRRRDGSLLVEASLSGASGVAEDCVALVDKMIDDERLKEMVEDYCKMKNIRCQSKREIEIVDTLSVKRTLWDELRKLRGYKTKGGDDDFADKMVAMIFVKSDLSGFEVEYLYPIRVDFDFEIVEYSASGYQQRGGRRQQRYHQQMDVGSVVARRRYKCKLTACAAFNVSQWEEVRSEALLAPSTPSSATLASISGPVIAPNGAVIAMHKVVRSPKVVLSFKGFLSANMAYGNARLIDAVRKPWLKALAPGFSKERLEERRIENRLRVYNYYCGCIDDQLLDARSTASALLQSASTLDLQQTSEEPLAKDLHLQSAAFECQCKARLFAQYSKHGAILSICRLSHSGCAPQSKTSVDASGHSRFNGFEVLFESPRAVEKAMKQYLDAGGLQSGFGSAAYVWPPTEGTEKRRKKTAVNGVALDYIERKEWSLWNQQCEFRFKHYFDTFVDGALTYEALLKALIAERRHLRKAQKRKAAAAACIVPSRMPAHVALAGRQRATVRMLEVAAMTDVTPRKPPMTMTSSAWASH